MQKLNILYTFCCILLCGTFAQAQNNTTEKPYELGLRLATLNFGGLSSNTPFIGNYFSGLFFRYHKEKIALRGAASYTQGSTKEPENCADCLSGTIQYSEIHAQIGGQYAFLKDKEWLYTFLDFGYSSRKADGSLSGGYTGNAYYKINSTANSISAVPGIGFRLKLFKTLYLCPEIGYAFSNNYITNNGLVSYSGYANLKPATPANDERYSGFLKTEIMLSARF